MYYFCQHHGNFFTLASGNDAGGVDNYYTNAVKIGNVETRKKFQFAKPPE